MRQSGIDLSSECTLEERSCITDAIKTIKVGGNFLEIGTAAGGTLKEIIQTADKEELEANFYVLDPFTYYPNQLQKVHKNLSNSDIDPSRVQFWQGTTDSHLPIALEKGLKFKFIFIDGDHKAHPVMNDLRWMGLLEVGGVACFHDYCDKFPGVAWSLEHFLSRNKQFSIILEAETLRVIMRNGENIVAVNRVHLLKGKFMQVFLRLRRSIKKRLAKKKS
mgnify:CR=1 FL=1